MSLLNDVMRDLQTRGVLGVPPLAGLQPVSGVPEQHRKRSHLLTALVALSAASAIVIWQPFPGGRLLPSIFGNTGVVPDEIETAPEAVVQESFEVEPVVVATGNDLRELFPIDSVAREAPATTADLVGEPVADTASESVAMVEVPAPESVVADEKRAMETLPVAKPPVVESKSNAATPAPAAPSTRTTILRRESGQQDVDGIVARATQSMRSRDFASAERLLREALAIDSSDAETWSFLYGVLVSASRPAAAEQALQQGLRFADEPAALAKLYARTLLDRGDRVAAVSVLTAHRPAAASDTDYDAFLAALLQQTGQYAEAGDIYQKLLTIDPNSGAWLVGLAMSHDSLGYRNEALLAFERALASGSLKSPLDRYARRRTAELKAYE